MNYRAEKWIPERAKEFSDANPHISIEPVANSGYEKLLALRLGESLDALALRLGLLDQRRLELPLPALHLQLLDALASRDKFDLRQFFPRSIGTARLDGKLLGLPTTTHPSHLGLFYNTNLFAEAGVKPPTADWKLDDLVDAARRLTRAGERWGFETETAYPPTLVWLRTFGGELMDPGSLGTKVALDRAPARQALQWLFDLRHRHRMQPVQGQEKATFTDGSVTLHTRASEPRLHVRQLHQSAHQRLVHLDSQAGAVRHRDVAVLHHELPRQDGPAVADAHRLDVVLLLVGDVWMDCAEV